MSGTNENPPTIRPLDDETGIHIFDPIESAQFSLFTSAPVDLVAADPDEFFFPMDVATGFEVDGLIVPKLLTVHLRRTDGEFVSTFDPSQDAELVEPGPLIVQLSTAPMTLYLKTDHEMTIRRHEQSVILSFDDVVPVELGVRSFHDSPTATIQVPDDPADAMTAVSYFGSALQTLSPERSFGTLRGHPPALERSESLEIPDVLDRPDSPVTIELPPEFEYVYPAAPLAFYLGATVEPGPEPRLRCGDLDRSLAGPDGYQATVHDLFQHLFFLDCVTRTEGLYPVDLHERTELERLLDEPVDFEALYDAPLADRVQRYLELPVEELESLRPTWHLCTDVEPDAEFVESLPAIVNELSLIRCPYTETAPPGAMVPSDPVDSPERRAAMEDISEFVRQPDGGVPPDQADWPLPEDTFKPPAVPAIEHEWLGTGIPIAANKATPETYRRRQDRPPADAEEIAIDVVCNDPPMDAERVVENYYGLRDLVTFDVTVHDSLTCEELADVLAASTDLLHYIGHVDHRGFRCSDGSLDAEPLDEVGCRAFLLNACTSYKQGQALIDAGSHGGVVTLTDVDNDIATETGRTIARLLNAGFTLRSALSITHDHHPTGQQYVVVGDGSVQLVQGESGYPYRIALRRTPDAEGELELDYYVSPSASCEPGAFMTTNIGTVETHYLPFGYVDTFYPSKSELAEFLALQRVPVEIGCDLVWSDEFELADLRPVGDVTTVRDDRPGFR